MSVSGLIALVCCMASIFAKILFSMRIKRLERTSERESANYHAAKKELHVAVQNHRRIEAQIKQLEGRSKSIQRGIDQAETTLEGLHTRKQEDVREYQKEMIKGKPR